MSASKPAKVLAIDPGKLTGVAYLVKSNNLVDIIATAELNEDEIIPFIRPIIEDWRGDGDSYPLRVVIERFTITIETAKKSQAPFSLEVIGAVKQVCRDAGYPLDAIAWQSPTEAKVPFPNEKLKRLGLWHKGGKGHALDALRHAATYLVRSGWRDSGFSA